MISKQILRGLMLCSLLLLLAGMVSQGALPAVQARAGWTGLFASDQLVPERLFRVNRDADALLAAVLLTDPENGDAPLMSSSLVVSEADLAATDRFDVALTEAPTGTVTIELTSDGECTVSPAQLIFGAGDFTVAQTVTVAAVDDAIDEDDPHNCQVDLDFGSSTDAAYALLGVVVVDALVRDDDTIGVTLTDPDNNDTLLVESSLVINEAATVAERFGLKLKAEPLGGDVTVGLTSDAQCTVSPLFVTFTAADHDQPQTVDILPVDDNVDEPDPHACIVTLSYDTSVDFAYGALPEDALSIVVQDNDGVGVLMTDPQNGGEPLLAGGLAVDESTTSTDSLLIQLASEPADTVSVAVSTDDQCTASPAALTFTSADYAVPRAVSVMAIDDEIAEALTHTCLLTLAYAGSADADYAILPAHTWTVLVADDDEIGVALTDPSNANALLAEGDVQLNEASPTASDLFGVLLKAAPSDEVSFVVSSDGQCTASPSMLTIASSNVNRSGTVTVKVLDDEEIEENPHICVITLDASSSAAAEYAQLPALTVNVRVLDDDASFCASVSEIPQSECEALVAIHNGTDGPNWANGAGWLDTTTPCSWTGVTCTDGRVTGLNLAQNQLAGQVPCAIGALSRLTDLNLSQNRLTGPIPCELVSMQLLQTLDLSQNQLTGELPSQLGNLDRLRQLKLNANQLTGIIPNRLGKLTNLELLYLGSNQLYGTVPATFAGLTSLQELQVSANRLSGQIPSALAALTLSKLEIQYNAVRANSASLSEFLARAQADWEQTQTVAPADLAATATGADSVLLSWTPIAYQGDGGTYEISYATSPAGPFTVDGTTVDKQIGRYPITGLDATTTYYFRVRTYTPAHSARTNGERQDGEQQNELWSDYSATTALMIATPTPLPTYTPTSTATPSSTPTATATHTAVNAPTNRPGPLPTTAPTATPSPTPSPTPATASNPTNTLPYDLNVDHMEFTQAIQTMQNDVSLIAGKPLVARMTIGFSGGSPTVGGVRAELRAFRNGKELSGSPLAPFNGSTFGAPTAPNRERMDDTLNFTFPTEWLAAGEIAIEAVVNPGGADTNNGNNTMATVLTLHTVAPLEVVLVPIAYQHNGSGTIYRPALDGSTGFGLGFVQDAYPVADVQYTIHSELAFAGNLYDIQGWRTLLGEIRALRNRELADPSVRMPKYYGVVRVAPGCCLPSWPLNPAAAAGGMADSPGGAAVGVESADFFVDFDGNGSPDAPTPKIGVQAHMATHELGHTLGLGHAPCNVSGEAGFPQSDGSIGDVGIYIPDMSLVASSRKDVMSYCFETGSTPTQWISAYNYQRLYDALATQTMSTNMRRSTLQNAATLFRGTETAWLVSGEIVSGTSSFQGAIESALTISSTAVLSNSAICNIYEIRLVDDRNETLFSYFFDPDPVDEDGGDNVAVPNNGAGLLSSSLPRIGQDESKSTFALVIPKLANTDRIQIWRGETFLDELKAASAPPTLDASIKDGLDAVAVDWAATDPGAEKEPTVMIRYSPDNGNKWIVIKPTLPANGVLNIDKSQLTASENGLIEVSANNNTESVRNKILVGFIANKAPKVSILGGAVRSVLSRQSIVLQGEATDFEDGPISSVGMTWSNADSKQLGSGPTLIITDGLPKGEQTLTLTAKDSTGATTSSTVTLHIRDSRRITFFPIVVRE